MSTTHATKRDLAGALRPPSRNIPSLDGLRAVSILIVILGHANWFFPEGVQRNIFFRSIVGNGTHGVVVFFVISGFLITTLLLREFDKAGTVSLSRFYYRRSMRIFPPFYVFLLAIFVLWKMGIIPLDVPSFIAAATYTWAYFPWAHGYFITHSWSLSIEEQFYLLWPLTFLLWHSRKKLMTVSLLLITVMPVIRVSSYFIAPGLRGHEGYMVQGWIDTMMVGCLLALAEKNPEWRKWRGAYLKGWMACLMAIIPMFLLPVLYEKLPKRMEGFLSTSIGPPFAAFCVAGCLIYLVTHPETWFGKILNNKVVRHLGVISYSLYLWQQIFMSHLLHLLPFGFLYALGVAELSFWAVERPSLKIRGPLERILFRTEPGPASKSVVELVS